MTTDQFPKTAIEWMDKLISFDTTSRNSNLPIVTYLASYFDSTGVPYKIMKDSTGQKANIFATMPALHGSKNGGIILSGHLDVVPVDGQKWDTDPFKIATKGDKIFGRGTCDMKGFISICMSLIPAFLKLPRSRPVYFAWTYDEEVGCLGGRELTQYIKEQGIRVDGCVVGEPTSNKIIIAHKGICVWKVKVTGLAKHSSYALAKGSCNAIDYAAKLIVKIREIAEDMRMNGTQDKFFDVPFSTASTNMISGGIAANTVPSECEFVYEFRNIPALAQDTIQARVTTFVEKTLLPQIRKEYDQANIVIENVARVPGMAEADEKDPFLIMLRTLTGDRDTRKLAGGTEAGQFAIVGVPVVVCGPGDLGVAHQANEFVPIKDLEQCEKMVLALITKNQSNSRI